MRDRSKCNIGNSVSTSTIVPKGFQSIKEMRMGKLKNRNLSEELKTVCFMIDLYCRKKHHAKTLCKECLELREYVAERIGRCKFIEQKPVCRKCPVHCYKPPMREKIRAVMRFAGPPMVLYHPLAAVKHLIQSLCYRN
jgi:hypothetical protein